MKKCGKHPDNKDSATHSSVSIESNITISSNVLNSLTFNDALLKRYNMKE